MGNDYLTEEVHLPLCNFLQNAPSKKRLIEMPRGFLKTTVTSEYYPLWRSINDPSIRVLITQNTFDNAAKRVHTIRSIYEKNQLFRALYPELVPDFNSKSIRWSDECAEINRPMTFPEGTFEAAGVNTKITARHYDLIIEDDLVAADASDLSGEEIAPNMEDVQKAIGWHKMATNLAVNPNTLMRIHVGTRWFSEDIINHIKKNEKGYAKFFIDVYGRKFVGEALTEEAIYPLRFSNEILEEQKEELGVYMFATQKLLDPMPLERMVFKPEWTRYFNTAPETKNILLIDPAIGESKRHCDSAFLVAGGASNGLMYILENISGQIDFGEQVKLAFALMRKWDIHKLVVETIAYQEALAQAIENERDRVDDKGVKVNEDVHFSVVREIPGGRDSKESRIRGLIPFFQSGKFLFAKHLKKLETQCREFPYGKKRDSLDVLAYVPKNLGFAKPKKTVQVYDQNSFEAIIEQIRGKDKGNYPFDKARRYSQNATPAMF